MGITICTKKLEGLCSLLRYFEDPYAKKGRRKVESWVQMVDSAVIIIYVCYCFSLSDRLN